MMSVVVERPNARPGMIAVMQTFTSSPKSASTCASHGRIHVALQHFAPETALPGALFAAGCALTAAGASAYLKRAPQAS